MLLVSAAAKYEKKIQNEIPLNFKKFFNLTLFLTSALAQRRASANTTPTMVPVGLQRQQQ